MNTIGSVGYERQPHIRQAPPAAAPFDRDSDHNRDHDKDHDKNAPEAGTASAPSTASTQHAVNVTA